MIWLKLEELKTRFGKIVDPRELAEDIVDEILIKLSETRLAGDALEKLDNEEYDKLEDELIAIAEKAIMKDEL